ncbi:MAG: deoxyribonuclease IV [Anaerolineae bacterium]
MLRLGAHESIAGGLHRALERAESAGCDAVQIWTKNSRQWDAPPLDSDAIRCFAEARASRDIHPIVAHASYLINIASPKPSLHRRSTASLIEEAERCEQLDIPFLVLHPGAHTGAGLDTGLEQAARALRETQQAIQSYRLRILLETTAGQGTALGATFEELGRLLDTVDGRRNFGVCLDTCHVFAAGYELRTPEGYDITMTSFDQQIGLDQLYVIHLNDSRYPLGSHRDRHEHIGEGHLGLDGFQYIVNDSRLDGRPGILETPKSDDLHEDRENLARLRALADGSSPERIRPIGEAVVTTDETDIVGER